MLNTDHIPEATKKEKALYKWQAEHRILPKVGFKNADEVRHALENNGCHIIENN